MNERGGLIGRRQGDARLFVNSTAIPRLGFRTSCRLGAVLCWAASLSPSLCVRALRFVLVSSPVNLVPRQAVDNVEQI